MISVLLDVHGSDSANKPMAVVDSAQANQYTAVKGLIEIAARPGLGLSWNTGVGYARLLGQSSVRKEITEFYKEAGPSLSKDLATLDKAPRISADPGAVARMSGTRPFTGKLTKPQLSVHTVGAPSDAAEHLAAPHTLEHRLDTGRWAGTDPASLNSRATAADPTTPLRYVPYRPAPYPRPYNLAHPSDGRPATGSGPSAQTPASPPATFHPPGRPARPRRRSAGWPNRQWSLRG